jgi:hypothetical protein
VFDEFTLSKAATITSADFLIYNYGSVPQQGELAVYTVDGKLAGTELFSQQVPTTSLTAVSDPNAWNVYRLTVEPTSLNLAAGSYFMTLGASIYGNAFAMETFSSNGANPVTASAYTYQSGTMDDAGIGGYSISGTEVPEPSVLALFGLGAAGAFAARRRNAARGDRRRTAIDAQRFVPARGAMVLRHQSSIICIS